MRHDPIALPQSATGPEAGPATGSANGPRAGHGADHGAGPCADHGAGHGAGPRADPGGGGAALARAPLDLPGADGDGPQPEAAGPPNLALLRNGLEGFRPLAERIATLEAALARLAALGDEATAKEAGKLRRRLDGLEPSVTLIGQVKAGKTALVNAMAGWPGLLPSDVNPWTSVVTSLHLSPRRIERTHRASFSFFDGEEWARLVERGGRVGELASRAGADDELQRVRDQVAEMREKSRRRLGRKFELLLGQTHDYGRFDQEMIERYVCLGDDFDEDEDSFDSQGRFADITKSADLWIDRPELPVSLCLRDTPGVNDTFMMREQITIRAIRDSRLCVVVLSAHQALSSVDMAIIRLIANVRSREVVIFVNRIDELSDPGTQVPEIRDRIRATLQELKGPADAEIVFGSAYWANAALSGTLDGLADASASSLVAWAEAELAGREQVGGVEEMIWELSGVPALNAALAARIVQGPGDEALARVAASAL